ncbi:hypothetical protein INT45_005622 [Circinella minor]|uniref:Uncharacterized protein n=1 Tax=Circinella minor TaxID=1195481 RepID=A0A8H7SBB7_9FUNG|nr:hypothetical protein INT45_005622 [Circinella minor]
MSLFGWIFRSRRRRPVSWRLRSSNNNKNHHHHPDHHSNQQQQEQKTQKRNSDIIIIDNDLTPPLPPTTKPVAGIDKYSSTKSNENLIHADSNNNETVNNYNNEDLLFQCIQTALLTTPPLPVPPPCRRRGSRQPRPQSTIIKNTTSTLDSLPTKRWSTGMLFVDFEEVDNFYYSIKKQKQLLQTSSIRQLHSPSLLPTTIVTSNTTPDKLYADLFNNYDDNNNNSSNVTTTVDLISSPQLLVTPRNSSVAQGRRSNRVQNIPPTCGYHFLNSIPEIVEHNNSITTAASQKPPSSTPFPPLNLT